MARICRQFAIIISGIGRLDIICTYRPYLTWLNDTPWLELFRLFTAVRTLRIISPGVERFIVSALRGLGGGVSTEVFPVLEDLYLPTYPSESEQQDIEQFIIARQNSDHPVTRYAGLNGDFWSRNNNADESVVCFLLH